MKKLLGLVFLLLVAGAVCFLVFPEFNQRVRDAIAQLDNSGAAPAVDFTADLTGGVDTVEVQFKDTSAITGTGWTWAFGDNATHIMQNPRHRFTWPTDPKHAEAQVVTFDVTLRVDGHAGPATTTKHGFVTLYRPLRVDAVVASTEQDQPLTGDLVRFESSVSGPVVSYSWDFGDGETGTGKETEHAYASAGAFTVTLTATGALSTNTAMGNANVTLHEPVVVPAVVGLSVMNARVLLQEAGLKWHVTHSTRTLALTNARNKLAATPKELAARLLNTGGRGIFGGGGLPIYHSPPNPAWAPLNDAYQLLSAANDRDLRSGVWTVGELRLPGDGNTSGGGDMPPVAKGSVVELVCK